MRVALAADPEDLAAALRRLRHRLDCREDLRAAVLPRTPEREKEVDATDVKRIDAIDRRYLRRVRDSHGGLDHRDEKRLVVGPPHRGLGRFRAEVVLEHGAR